MKIVDLKEKNQLFEERCKELEAKERQMDFAKRELESKQKQLDDRIRELELKEKKLANIIQIRVGADQSERNSPSLDLGFVVTMFGKGLQLFLNEHVKYHDSIAGKVLEALKQSIDPAKLILDAMEGFYPPHLKKGNFEFEGSVVRRSCILLLEQIMKISPTIRTDVREAALGIAAEWKTKMKPVVENWSEVLGFLSLLAAYELGGDFDVDELLSLYKIVPQHRQTPDLFMLLGFTDEIGGATSKQRKRSLDLGKCYDSARNAARKPRLPPKQLIQDKIPNISTFQFGGLNDHRSTQPDLSDGRQSFWTCCPFCTMKYKYYQDFVNRSLRCQNCSKPFIAYDLGARPVSNQAHTGSNRGQPQVSQQKQVPTKSFKLGARSSGPFNSFYLRSEANSSRKMGSEHVTRTRGTAEVGGGLKNNVKGIAHVNTEEGNTVDAAKTRESGTSRDGKMKRGTPPKRSHENTIGAHDATLSNQANPGSEDSTHSFGRAQPPISQKQVPTKACNMGAHSSGEFPSYNFGSDANSNRKVGSEYVTRTGGTTEVGGGLKNKVRGNVRVNTEANRGVGMSKVDAANARVSWTSRDKNRKRGRKLAVDSSESFDTTTSSDSEEVEFEESGGSPAVHNSRSESVHSPRRSSRQKQNVSYNENAIDDDFMSPPKSSHERKYSDAKEDQKEPFNNEEFKVEVNKKEIKRKRSEPAEGSSQYANDGAVKHQVNVEEDVTLDSGAKKYSVIDDSEAKPNLGSTSDPEVYECPDPEFSDFDQDKDEKCFSVDQVWACYDTIDGMPRFYAQVKKVFSPGFKLRFTWLEADPEEQGEIDWVNEGLPVGCGKFTRGDTEETSDRLTFSHLIHFEKGIGRGSYVIYPRRGETWALFKDWDIGWSSDSENHKKYIFEIVEILSDFSHDTGIMIGCLAKIKGFVSLFQRTTRGGVGSCLIPSSELLRFSHRIPSFKMTGAERDGVPEGSFELDPASLPTNPNELWQPEEEKVEAQSMNVKVNSSSSKSSDGKAKSMIGSENSSTPKKCVDFEGKNYFDKEVAKLRRSPRELNSTIKKSVHAYSVPCASQSGTAKHLNGSKNQTGDFTPSKRKASSSQGDEEIHIGMAKSPIDLTESPSARPSFSVGARVSEDVFYNFNVDKSVGEFRPGQIWALYSSTEKFPNSYAQIKKTEPSPFKLYAVLLEPCTFKQPVCCGMFTVPNGKPKVFSPSSFSHLMREEPISKIKHEIYPKEGEIWAIYKNWNAELSCPDMKNCEFDIVEVLKANEFCTEVSSLVHLPGFKSVFKARRRHRSNTGLLTIPRGDLFRFSHQIPAFQLTSEKDGYLKGCWELDPAALPSDMLCNKPDG